MFTKARFIVSNGFTDISRVASTTLIMVYDAGSKRRWEFIFEVKITAQTIGRFKYYRNFTTRDSFIH